MILTVSEESDLREIRDQVSNMTIVLARLEERLEKLCESNGEAIKILRGDGNGESGMILRLSHLASQLNGIRSRITTLERRIEDISARWVGGSIARWKVVVAFVGAIATVITSVAALLTALLR